MIEPIHLFGSEEVLMDRVSAPERVQRGKISSPKTLKSYLDRNNVTDTACFLLRGLFPMFSKFVRAIGFGNAFSCSMIQLRF